MSNRPDNSASPAPSPTYHDFFRCATGGQTPCDYQSRLACGPAADPDKPATLRDRLGPLRLAFLETLLRAAAARVSKLEK